jgi:class 3 adenylate cyclase
VDALSRLLALGVDARDDADMRLRKFLLVTAVVTILPLTILWGAIYWGAGAPEAALIPWLYAAISAVSLVVYARSHAYPMLALSQFAPYSTFPFWLMWLLGGFVSGSAVALWAALGPIAALLLGHRRLALALAVEYALLMLVVGVAPAPAAVAFPAALRDALFVLNLTMVPLVAWLLVRLFAGGHQGALVAVRGLVRRYLSPEIAATLEADPRRTDLGGQIVEVSVLFADLGGYSSYAEHRSPEEVVGMLNAYFAIVLPAILEEGGSPTQLPGDAVMAVFGAPRPQADHADRACRAARAILQRTSPLATGPLRGPRFHIGINSGPALVGNIGSEDYRNFTAIGDTINVASRLEGVAQPGEVVIGSGTAALIAERDGLTPLGPVPVKGRAEPVEAFVMAAPDRATPAP